MTQLWMVTGVSGKHRERIEAVCGSERKILQDDIKRNIKPGEYLILEGDIIMKHLSEREGEKFTRQ